MSTQLIFSIDFQGPFHVAAGQAVNGLHQPVDVTVPLPASSLKGLLKAEALERLGINESLVGSVFGCRGAGSPWVWSDAGIATPKVTRAARIRVTPGGMGQATDQMLMLGEQVWSPPAQFTITQSDWIDPAELDDHILILTAAALSVTSLGGARRRGEGWVSISRVQPADVWTRVNTEQLAGLRNTAREQAS